MLGLTDPSGYCRVSVLRRAHPYSRVYCAIAIVLAAGLATSPRTLTALSALVFLVAVLGRLRIRVWLTGLVAIASMMFWLGLASFVFEARQSHNIAPASAFLVRCYLGYLTAAVLCATTEVPDILRALEILKAPKLLTALAGGALRWTFLLWDEARRMNTACGLRGGAESGRVCRLVTLTKLASSLTARSFTRAERVADAMECRGFDGHIHRCMPESYTARDAFPSLLIVAYIAAAYLVAI